MQTLKSRHDKKRVKRLIEHSSNAKKRLMLETRHANLLIEAMDDQDLNKASAIIDKLRGMKGKGLKSLDNAIQTAESELNKYTAGGPITKAWSKLKSIAGFQNPLVKFMIFASALENGFKQMPVILKNNLINVDLTANQDKTLQTLITSDEQRQVLLKNIKKALSPKGFLGAFKKIPYVDAEAFSQDIMNIPVKSLATIVKQSNSGPNTDQVAADLKDTAMAQGDPTTKGTSPSEPTQTSGGSNPTSPATNSSKTTGTTPVGEKPQNPAKIVDVIYKELSTSLIDAVGSEQKARAVLKLLADEGKLSS